MNYSKLSDFEINKAVAKSIGAVDVRQLKNMINEVYCEIDGMRSFKDFCNNPSDAWPIIVENNISINALSELCDDECDSYFVNGLWECCTVLTDNGEFFGGQDWIVAKDENPLRAAMIVYLMMQEQK